MNVYAVDFILLKCLFCIFPEHGLHFRQGEFSISMKTHILESFLSLFFREIRVVQLLVESNMVKNIQITIKKDVYYKM